MTKCRKETNRKYIKRKSPSYSANKCKYMKKKGFNNILYKSVPNKKGVFRWIKVKKTKKIKKLQSKHFKRRSTR